ncbi:MAG: hypothetical protein J5819_09930 [Eubacterium sp.]|nr:hypothetical protein [Eubacterium sp.]
MEILVGDEHINGTPFQPYDERVCDLLDAWAQAIRGDKEAKAYPDVLTFGFFIRRGSIMKKRKAFYGDSIQNAGNSSDDSDGNGGAGVDGVGGSTGRYARRIGRGIAFHIAPSNVPVNCMYTLVFGMLSGCSNIVRVPSKEFPQVDILCRTLREVLKKHRFSAMNERIQVIRYDRDERLPDGQSFTAFFSSFCDVRVIWGGDETIANIRENPMEPRAKEITFADRYSVGVIDVQAVREASDEEMARLARDFYNDTYLMDQNACSTPQLIAWSMKKYMDVCIRECVNRDGLAEIPGSPEDAGKMMAPGLKAVQERFWDAVAREAGERYDLADIKVSEKFADLCEFASGRDLGLEKEGQMSDSDFGMNSHIKSIKSYGDNLLYVCDVEDVTYETSVLCRGKYGLFFQIVGLQFDVLKPVLDNPKVQTVAVYGIETSEIADWVVKNGICGVDRVVPFGKTLDIDVVWDGYDLVSEMSRIVAG